MSPPGWWGRPAWVQGCPPLASLFFIEFHISFQIGDPGCGRCGALGSCRERDLSGSGTSSSVHSSLPLKGSEPRLWLGKGGCSWPQVNPVGRAGACCLLPCCASCSPVLRASVLDKDPHASPCPGCQGSSNGGRWAHAQGAVHSSRASQGATRA